MRHLRMGLVLLVPLAIMACEAPEADEAEMAEEAEPAMEQQSSPAMDRQAVDTGIDQIRDSWIEGALAKDAAAVASLYTQDAMMVGASGEQMDGRMAIQEGLAPGFENITSMDVTSLDRRYGADLVADMGRFSQTMEMEGGEQTIEGYYMVVARRQADGSWKLIQHLSTPPEGMDAGAMQGGAMQDTAGMERDSM
jgi:uncharacterized protein (TIGR02246 family)